MRDGPPVPAGRRRAGSPRPPRSPSVPAARAAAAAPPAGLPPPPQLPHPAGEASRSPPPPRRSTPGPRGCRAGRRAAGEPPARGVGAGAGAGRGWGPSLRCLRGCGREGRSPEQCGGRVALRGEEGTRGYGGDPSCCRERKTAPTGSFLNGAAGCGLAKCLGRCSPLTKGRRCCVRRGRIASRGGEGGAVQQGQPQGSRSLYLLLLPAAHPAAAYTAHQN